MTEVDLDNGQEDTEQGALQPQIYSWHLSRRPRRDCMATKSLLMLRPPGKELHYFLYNSTVTCPENGQWRDSEELTLEISLPKCTLRT